MGDLDNLENKTEDAFSISYRPDGVFLSVDPSQSIDKKLMVSKIFEKITRKNIKGANVELIQFVVDKANGEPVKIANPQEEAKADMTANISVSQDRMSASIVLIPPDGGKTLSKEDILKILQSKGIVFGVDDTILDDMLNNHRFHESIEIAKGQPPKKGDDGRLELLFETSINKKPTILEDGSVDFHELHNVVSAKKGEILANIISPKPGVQGKTVLGQSIPAQNGRPIPNCRGKNAEIVNRENGSVVVAAIDGQVAYIDNKISVLTVYEVPGNVDVSTGNIHFTGNVIVKGNVLTDYVIEAEGNVEIYGVVEGAIIKAGGDIILKRGIQGLHKGVLVSGNNIVAKYIEHCTVTVRNTLKTEAIMHSNVSCGNTIELAGKKGLIVGGVIKVGKEINAKVIGSPMSTITELEVGIDPTLRDRHKEIKETYMNLESELKKSEQAIEILSKMQAAGVITPEKKEMLNKLLRTKIQINSQLPQLREEIELTEEKLTATHSGKIKVQDTVYPGVKITIGTTSKFIKENTQYATFYLDGADIKTLPYERY